MIRLLRDLWLFFRRDLSIARTYRISFLLEIVEALFGTAMFYYVGRFVDSPQLRQALPQGGTYFAFSLVGFVFLDYMNASLDTFDRSLEEARNSGTLEHLLVTQTSLPVILAGSALYPFAATTLRIGVYLACRSVERHRKAVLLVNRRLRGALVVLSRGLRKLPTVLDAAKLGENQVYSLSKIFGLASADHTAQKSIPFWGYRRR